MPKSRGKRPVVSGVLSGSWLVPIAPQNTPAISDAGSAIPTFGRDVRFEVAASGGINGGNGQGPAEITYPANASGFGWHG